MTSPRLTVHDPISEEDALLPLRSLWKPVLQRAVTGSWRRFRMAPVEPPIPRGLERAGLYLHVPFCRNLCPYCPYNRTRYRAERFARYERALYQEIDLYAPALEATRFGSVYVGGGTPTVDPAALVRILRRLRERFSTSGELCVELHPAAMDERCLEGLRESRVDLVSIGVESLSDRLLALLGRSHDAATARAAMARARRAGFPTVNVDLMFALPGQTLAEWRHDLEAVIDAGVDQISTYPLFAFPYTELGRSRHAREVLRPAGALVRRMLRETDRLARGAGLERCAVWSWVRPQRHKFSSITRHHYLGLGPSAASMTGSHFYVNTFDVEAYADALPSRRPIALALPVDRDLEMAYWLYWRVYELEIRERDFAARFGETTLRERFGHLLEPLRLLGLVDRSEAGYRVTPPGAYWVHRLQNEYSLDYINRLWGCCRRQAWPSSASL